jgi:hypothetical protein
MERHALEQAYLREFSLIPKGYKVARACKCKGECLNPYHLIIKLKGYKMAKKDKKAAPAEEQKKKKGKKAPEQAPEQSKADKKAKGKAKDKAAESAAKESSDKATNKKADKSWDETESSGADFFKLPQGTTPVLIRFRSVISVGQVHFVFDGKKAEKATSGIAVVAECWPYKVDKNKGKIKLTSKEPAIVYHVFKALKGNKKAQWTKMMNALECKTPADLMDNTAMGEVFTSDKGYMYLRGDIKSPGLAEAKAIPAATKKGHAVPNLDCMTKEAMLELNPITQVKDYVLEAVNFPGSEAEKVVAKIRKDKPDFAKLSEKSKGDKEKSKKGKGKKREKLDESKEY